MSAGDRSRRTLEGPRDFERASSDPQFQQLLLRPIRLDFSYDVPYLAGSSVTGTAIYGDRNTPTSLDVGGINHLLRPPRVSTMQYPWKTWLTLLGDQRFLWAGIVTHEAWERTAMLLWGWDYPQAHELATYAEHHIACPRLLLTPDRYENIWNPVIVQCRKKLHAPGTKMPPDIDLTPYQEDNK